MRTRRRATINDLRVAIDCMPRATRIALLVSAMLIFITGLAVPRAFAGEATTFALTYAVVRLAHLALYADASRHGSAAWAAISGFAVTVGIGMALLIVGSLVRGRSETSSGRLRWRSTMPGRRG
jgi:low temperature requirement protein LtrA